MNDITTALTRGSLAGLEVKRVEERSRFLNMLIYGKPGVGKTRLAGSADAVPGMRPVLFVDIEGGTESLVSPYPNVETVRVTTWKEMQSVYNVLADGDSGYRTVVLDSLTEIQKFNMYFVMEEAARQRNNVDPEVPAQRDWGVSLEQIRRMVRGFRDLPMHTIFTALSKDDKDNKTGVTRYLPSLPGKLASEVAGFLDVVLYYYLKDVQGDDGETYNARLLLSQATDTVVAKDRTDKLPAVMQSPTMTALYNLMFEIQESQPTE